MKLNASARVVERTGDRPWLKHHRPGSSAGGMNTVGKWAGSVEDPMRGSSVMLTEGGMQTPSHTSSVRAFGTQLLCEQVIGRALRRSHTTQ